MQWLPSLRGLPRTYWTLWVGAFINRLGGFVATFLALYLTGLRGFTTEQAGATVAMYGLGGFVAGPLGGWLADRWGRRPTMLLSLLLGPLALLNLALMRRAWALALAAGLYGLGADLFRPANQAMIADVVPAADRARAFGILYWAINFGFGVAAAVGGSLAVHGYWLLFAIDGASTLVFALIVFLAVPESHPLRGRPQRSEPGALLAPLRDRPFVAFLLLNFLSALVFQQFFVAAPLDMRAHGVSAATYGLLAGLNGLLIVALQPLVLPHLARVPRSRALAGAALLIGLGFGANAIFHRPELYAVGITLWTLGEIIQAPLTFAVTADLAPAAQRGHYQGVFQISWGAALAISPYLGSVVLTHFGGPMLWAICLLLGALGALGHLYLGPSRGRRLAVARGDYTLLPASD